MPVQVIYQQWAELRYYYLKPATFTMLEIFRTKKSVNVSIFRSDPFQVVDEDGNSWTEFVKRQFSKSEIFCFYYNKNNQYPPRIN